MAKKITVANKVHIAGRGSVVRQLRILVSLFRVHRTGTHSEIPRQHVPIVNQSPPNLIQPENRIPFKNQNTNCMAPTIKEKAIDFLK
jgi:hypothetical protein